MKERHRLHLKNGSKGEKNERPHLRVKKKNCEKEMKDVTFAPKKIKERKERIKEVTLRIHEENIIIYIYIKKF